MERAFICVVVLCLRVVLWARGDEIDMSQLNYIKMGSDSFVFNEDDNNSALMMRSDGSACEVTE